MVSVAVVRANDGTLVLAVASCTEPSEAGVTSSCGLEWTHASVFGSYTMCKHAGMIVGRPSGHPELGYISLCNPLHGRPVRVNPFPPPGLSPPHALLARDRPAAPQGAPVVAR